MLRNELEMHDKGVINGTRIGVNWYYRKKIHITSTEYEVIMMDDATKDEFQRRFREIIRRSNEEDDRIVEELRKQYKHFGLDGNREAFEPNKIKTLKEINDLKAEYFTCLEREKHEKNGND